MAGACLELKKPAPEWRRGLNFHTRTALVAVLVALLTSLYMLFMAAAAGSAGLRVAATGRGIAGIGVVLVTLLPGLDVLFVGSTLVCHLVLLGFELRPRRPRVDNRAPAHAFRILIFRDVAGESDEAADRAGRELVCHFVGRREKAEKSRCSPAPPRPLGAARNLASKTAYRRKGSRKINRIPSGSPPPYGPSTLSKSKGRSSLKETR